MTRQDNIDDFGFLKDGSTLVIQRWLPGPPERVWQYLTDSDLRRTWLAAGVMPLVSGATMELVWRNDTLSAADDPRPAAFPEEQWMQSTVVAIDPPRLLTIAWGNGEVTFALVSKGGRVLLTITHTGLDDKAAQRSIAGGWHVHLDILVACISGTDQPSFWSGWTRLQGIYDTRLSQWKERKR
jgi:uncharacterized protein YndB with AHSA1/START domain